jgi:calcium-dependent protein kinase
LTEDRLTALFKTFDIDDTGFITMENLKDSFSKLNRDITPYELAEIMKEHDLSKDNRIDL